MECPREHSMKADAPACRTLSASYLQCRMDAQLMAREELSRLGYQQSADGSQPAAAKPAEPSGPRERRGFTAGLPPTRT